jgi:hypothetical protein
MGRAAKSNKINGLVLDFPTVYHCAIKPFKQCPQNRTVCIFLAGKPVSTNQFTDAALSNYISGKRAIPDDARKILSTVGKKPLRMC